MMTAYTNASIALRGKNVAITESTPQTDIRPVCVIHATVGQHLNCYRASRGSVGDS